MGFRVILPSSNTDKPTFSGSFPVPPQNSQIPSQTVPQANPTATPAPTGGGFRPIISSDGSIVSPLSGSFQGQAPGAPAQDAQGTDTGSFVGNALNSAGNFVGGLADAVTHPLRTIGSLGKIAVGGVEKIAGEQPDTNTQAFDGLIHYFGQRYGGNTVGDVVNNIGQTAYKDPVGFLADLATVIDGGAGVIGKVGDLSKVSEISDLAKTVGSVGEKVNPINLATRPIALASDVTGLTDKLGSLKDAITQKLSQPFTVAKNEDVINATKDLGIDQSSVPASMVNSNPTVNFLESLSAKGGGAAKFAQKFTDLNDTLENIKNTTLENAGKAQDLTETGQNISSGIQQFQKAFNDTTSKLYDTFSKKGADLPATVQNTVDTLNSIIDSKSAIGEDAEAAFFKKKLDIVTGGENGVNDYKLPTFDTLKKIRTSIGEKVNNAFGDPFASQNAKALKDLYSSLTTDMNETVKQSGYKSLGKQFEAAQNQYKQGLALFNTGYAKSISKLSDAGQFDKIVPSLLKKSTSVEDIPKIRKVIGEANFKQLQYHLLDQVFEKATSIDGTHITGQGINRALKTLGEKNVRLILDPAQVKVLDDMQTVAGAIDKAQKLAKGSQTAFIGEKIAQTGLAASAIGDLFAGNIHLAVEKLVPIVGSNLANKFIASDLGQSILKNGIDFSKITESKPVKYGGKVVKSIANQTVTNASNVNRNVVINRSQQQ